MPNEESIDLGPSDAESYGALVGRDAKLRRLFRLLDDVAATDATVLIEGETGTGKELLAEEIHRHSPRKDGPFVVFDCGAVPDELIESALFGHVRGAFTGAVTDRRGAFEEADGGTLFLDEIGELSLAVQPALLRALDKQSVRPVGGSTYTRASVRVVAATNRNLRAEIAARQFREDLYYRVAVVRMQVPPLRERLDDIPLLVEHFTRQFRNGERAADRAATTWRACSVTAGRATCASCATSSSAPARCRTARAWRSTRLWRNAPAAAAAPPTSICRSRPPRRASSTTSSAGTSRRC